MIVVVKRDGRKEVPYSIEKIKKYDGNIYTNSNEHEFTLIIILPLKLITLE